MALRVRFGRPVQPVPTTPFRFPEARHGRGELFYHEDVPILRVEGTPEEVGEQLGVLSMRPAPRLLEYPEDLLHGVFRSRLLARLLLRRATRVGGRLLSQFPEVPRRELESMISTGLDRDRMVLGNTLYDLKNISLPQVLGCSSLVVPAGRSATGGPLFGRNLDFFGLGYLHEYSLVTVRPRTGRALAYATVGFPGTLGCFSGMNEAGLALASHEVFGLSGPRRYNPGGVPFILAARRVLEECTSTQDAFKLLSQTERTTSMILVLCDRSGGKVLEVTPDHIVEYASGSDVIACTNHYRTTDLALRRPSRPSIIDRLTARLEAMKPGRADRRPPRPFRTAERLGIMEGMAVERSTFALTDLTETMHAVHQDDQTIQSMVFEPAASALHVAFGKAPTTARPPVRIDLHQLWATPSSGVASTNGLNY